MSHYIAPVGLALWRLCFEPGRHHPLAPFLAAPLGGGLIVGLVGSVLDVSRVAFLLFLALSLGGSDERAAKRNAA